MHLCMATLSQLATGNWQLATGTCLCSCPCRVLCEIGCRPRRPNLKLYARVTYVWGGLEGPANNAWLRCFVFFRFVSFSVSVSSLLCCCYSVAICSGYPFFLAGSRRSRCQNASLLAALRRDDDFLLPSSVCDRFTLRWRINVANKRIVIAALARLTHVVLLLLPQHIGLLFIKLCLCVSVCVCVNKYYVDSTTSFCFVILVALQVHKIHWGYKCWTWIEFVKWNERLK